METSTHVLSELSFIFISQMKEDELEELRELNRHLRTLLKEKDEKADILKHNFNVNRYLPIYLSAISIKNWSNYSRKFYFADSARKIESSEQ